MTELLGFVSLADEIDDYVHRDAPDKPVALIDHRRRYQVVAFERMRRLLRLVVRRQGNELGVHHGANQHFRIRHDEPVDRQHPFDDLVAIHHEHLVGVIGQFIHAPQIAQDDLQGNVVAHRNHVEVHQRAD